jgi:hypothetical protein
MESDKLVLRLKSLMAKHNRLEFKFAKSDKLVREQQVKNNDLCKQLNDLFKEVEETYG